MSTRLEDLLRRHVDAGTIPGAVALLGSEDEPEVVAVGQASGDGRPLRSDAVMRIQSMTKAVTTVAALRLVEAGHLRLDDSVQTWLPELTAPRVLPDPEAELTRTAPARQPVTLRHLLTNASGYGMPMTDCPLLRAMTANQTAAGPEPVTLGADEWLARLAELPLMFHPGEGWRYHHSFGLLGILLARLTGRPLQEHLTEDLFGPLGMTDTAFSVPEAGLHRLSAAWRHGADGLVETEPAGGGFYAGPPPFNLSHAELVSTVTDYGRFLRVLADGGRTGGAALLSAEHLQLMTSDQVPAAHKTPGSFFPGFWDGMGWGFGVAVQTVGPRRGRFGWSGGQGTDFFVDRDGTVAILFTQVELGEQMGPLLGEFQDLHHPGDAAG